MNSSVSAQIATAHPHAAPARRSAQPLPSPAVLRQRLPLAAELADKVQADRATHALNVMSKRLGLKEYVMGSAFTVAV